MSEALSTAFLVASGESALIEAGATSEESSAILRVDREKMAREIWMWHNPSEWARYALTMHRLHGSTSGAEAAGPPPTKSD